VDEPLHRTWYGWQTLVVDGVALTSLVIAADSNYANNNSNETLVALGVAGYFLGPPIVHFVHGNVGVGFGSLAIRGGSFGVLVLGAASCYGRSDSVCGFGVLGALGMIAAIPIDAAVFAYETDEEYEDEHDPDAESEEQTSFGPFRRLSLTPVFGSSLSRREGTPSVGAPGYGLPGIAFDGLVLTGAF
jgi:hypothetical protein